MIKPNRSRCISISHIYWLLADKAPKQNEENLKHCLNVANQNEDLKIISFFVLLWAWRLDQPIEFVSKCISNTVINHSNRSKLLLERNVCYICMNHTVWFIAINQYYSIRSNSF